MLAKTRSAYLTVFFFFAFCLAIALPFKAQAQGLPPSVTSLGFGGFNNEPRGIAPSVTSLRGNSRATATPFWGNCCVNFFAPSGHWRSDPMPPLRPEWRRHHRDGLTYFPVAVPAYIPYGVPYAVDVDEQGEYDYDSDSDASAYAANFGPVRHTAGKRTKTRIEVQDSDDDAPQKAAPPEQAQEPVPSQPATVLVFKDGHRSDVENYAIVGNTLFDFAEGRSHKILLADLDIPATEKANDEHGVDFRVPSNSR